MATQETPINQLPQIPQDGGNGNAPSADPMIQNILNNYNQQQNPEQMEASIPSTADDIYDSEQAKYQDRQFGLQPPPQPEEPMDYYYGDEQSQYEEDQYQEDLPFYKKWLNYLSFSDIKKSLLVSGLFLLLSLGVIDSFILKKVPRFATVIDNSLSLNMVGLISKSAVAGLLFFIISQFL